MAERRDAIQVEISVEALEVLVAHRRITLEHIHCLNKDSQQHLRKLLVRSLRSR